METLWTGYRMCGIWCEMKMWHPVFRITKHFKTALQRINPSRAQVTCLGHQLYIFHGTNVRNTWHNICQVLSTVPGTCKFSSTWTVFKILFLLPHILCYALPTWFPYFSLNIPLSLPCTHSISMCNGNDSKISALREGPWVDSNPYIKTQFKPLLL